MREARSSSRLLEERAGLIGVQEYAVLDPVYLDCLVARIAVALADIVPPPMQVVVGQDGSALAFGTHRWS